MPEARKRHRTKRRQTKDKVLQARIPEDLDQELRDRAGQLGLSVSTIVRNVLLHTFDLVEGVVADSAQIARAAHGQYPEKEPSAHSPGGNNDPEEPVDIIGWQELTLNINGVCEQCNEVLLKGTCAAVGIPAGRRPVFLCTTCLSSLSSSSAARRDKDDTGTASKGNTRRKSTRRNKRDP